MKRASEVKVASVSALVFRMPGAWVGREGEGWSGAEQDLARGGEVDAFEVRVGFRGRGAVEPRACDGREQPVCRLEEWGRGRQLVVQRMRLGRSRGVHRAV